jgi:PLP dependent protein
MTMHTDLAEIAKRRGAILAELAACGTPPPVLVAVSKTQDAAAIDAVLATGQRVFGENRVQEAMARWLPRLPGLPDLELRLIGPLQTNKAEDAVRLFDVIETLDRPSLITALARAVQKTGRTPQIFIEVNTGEEPQKAGVLPAGLGELHAGAVAAGLNVCGLMCIPPQGEPAAPHFALLANLARRLELAGLSMGMSGDYPLAARLGATHVRLGTALFGARAPILPVLKP